MLTERLPRTAASHVRPAPAALRERLRIALEYARDPATPEGKRRICMSEATDLYRQLERRGLKP